MKHRSFRIRLFFSILSIPDFGFCPSHHCFTRRRFEWELDNKSFHTFMTIFLNSEELTRTLKKF